MTLLEKKWEEISGLMKKVPNTLREKTKLRLLFDGHFTPSSGARLARMFPMHLDLELSWVSPGKLSAAGTCEIESHLEMAAVSGTLHIVTPENEPVLRLNFETPEGTSTLAVARLGRDFWTHRQLEGTIDGALKGDVTLRLPSEQFLRIFHFH